MSAPAHRLLELKGFSVAYGPVEAVHRVELHVDEGEIVTVIGPNGAGKTTLLCAAMGLLPSTGTLSMSGETIVRPSVEAMVARGVSLVPEKRELFGEMTVEDNLLLGGFYRWRTGRRDQRERMAEVFAIFPRLQERRAQTASTLSGGERQMLAIGRALMARPRLLMLDEPSQGIMPKLVDEIFAAAVKIRGAGTTVLIVEQRVTECLEIADRAYVLRTGKVIMRGTAAEIRDDPEIRKAYLGL